MNNNPKILAIIPARGGSKGIPRKNLVKIANTTLLTYTIWAAQHSKYKMDIVVSSEDEEILRHAEKYCLTKNRPADLATDTASCDLVAYHVLKEAAAEGKFYDIVILLQPTSPLRLARDIDEAIDAYLLCPKDELLLISGYEPEKNPLKSFILNNNGFLQAISTNDLPFENRQNLPKTFTPNGAIYIIDAWSLLAYKRFFSENIIPYHMPIERSIDIDTPADLQKAEEYLKNQSKNQ